jgi:hypothetical protein
MIEGKMPNTPWNIGMLPGDSVDLDCVNNVDSLPLKETAHTSMSMKSLRSPDNVKSYNLGDHAAM